jgi:hypothetical protein
MKSRLRGRAQMFNRFYRDVCKFYIHTGRWLLGQIVVPSGKKIALSFLILCKLRLKKAQIQKNSNKKTVGFESLNECIENDEIFCRK